MKIDKVYSSVNVREMYLLDVTKRWVCWIVFLFGMMMILSNPVLGEGYRDYLNQDEKVALSDVHYSLSVGGYQLLSVTWPVRNDSGEIISERGLHALMGYTSRHYYRPVALNKVSYYWHWGTWFLAIPYVGIGVEYNWDNHWFLAVETSYVFPAVRLGKRF